MTRDEILAVLAEGNLEAIVGSEESEWLDFKRSLYDLDSEWQKFELAKDVSALANLLGGLIVMGYRTETPPDTDRERAVELRPVPRERVSEQRYRSLIRSHVYPTVIGLRVEFVPSVADDTIGVLFIEIPEQPTNLKPFLIAEALSESAGRVRGWLFGIAHRSLDETVSQQLGELHALLAQGQNLLPRLDTLEASLAELASGSQPMADRDERAADNSQEPKSPIVRSSSLDEKVEERLSALPTGNQSEAVMYLAATPATPATVPSLFRTEGVRSLLENPPTHRPNGWNLVTLDRARIERGRLLVVSNGLRKHVALFNDGSFVAIASFPRFFVRDPRPGISKVNPLALVEFTYEFVHAYLVIADYMEPRPTASRFRIGLRRAAQPEARLFLPPYSVNAWAYQAGDPEDYPPTDEDSFDAEITEEIAGVNDVGRAAFSLLARIYPVFGRLIDEIPNVNDACDAVDPATF